MQFKSFKYKFLFTILSLFIVFLFVEFSFRMANVIINKKTAYHLKTKNTYRILCTGDSSTYGIGASDPEKFSYPSQLQKILNEKCINRLYEVINIVMNIHQDPLNAHTSQMLCTQHMAKNIIRKNGRRKNQRQSVHS